MNESEKNQKHAAYKPKGKGKNPERKSGSGLFVRKRGRMDIAIQVTGGGVALLLIIIGIVSVSSINAKFTVTLWLGFAAAVLTLFGLCLFWQKVHWEKEAKAAAELAAKHRPELFIEEAALLPLALGKPQTIMMLVANRGDRPARRIKLGPSNTSLRLKDFVGPLVYGQGTVDTTPDLGAGAKVTVAVKVLIEITEERFEQLNNGELLYFHYGEGSYEDDSGRTYRMDFCFMYSPMAPTILRTCPDEYRPAKDREQQKQS